MMVHGHKGFKFRNWAKTYGCHPEMYFQPTCVEEVKQVLDLARQQNKRVKATGGGHSPSDIACTDGFMIHMGKMNRILKVDKEKCQVTVEAGILLMDLNVELRKHGLALANLGAVSDVTAAGVIGTGTHNTGIKHGILSTQVVALSLLTAAGTIIECSETSNADLFKASLVHLGCLGIILTVTFQCVPQFHLQETSFPSTLKEVLDNLDSHLKKSEYFRFLWFPHSDNVSVIYQDHTNKPPTSAASWFWDYAVGFYLLEFLLWVSTFLPALVPWINRFFFWLLFANKVESSDISYKILNYECRFKQYVQDWAIPIENTAEALLDLKTMLEKNPKVVAHFPVEVRFVKGDDILLSPCFQKDSCYMNIIMYRPYGKDVPRLDYWLAYERIMKKFGGRPHWAKAHTCTRKDFEEMYPSFQKFCAIQEKLDPTGMFLNAYLEKVFY
ncbi:L-gulonolactone oxidase isoform X2 [Phascolarctos cinereus]|uniref:L-gulonolactone oxidase n=1 Tax=Phascolarctos cinereus TaxID=38626 RepID=A0A6P5K2Z1_PHACI|nr:L-gulonolactone oxidase isoform X2 [Phascolarctos cinereus]XP_020839638.1 L-gulonolactone oxidase isoform X2 [Phascolarctos cinereus]XP_020839639.1 L-gulonolactone oxidase isoform X2 [Phascolarctos cinereus]XP_020839640.1 L-gulonolactone oxidase isoform X2 [Phascolarctos cinereus]